MSDNSTGKMFVFTAPSGAGKTTIVKYLLAKYSELDFSVSATTRKRREHEIEGKDYYFMHIEDFNQKINQNAFIEWEEVYKDQYYGTLFSEVDRIWKLGKHIVFDIDVEGAMNIKALYGTRCMSVFVRPPSFETLKERLINRHTETEESLNKRILKAEREMEHENSFDIVLVNDILDVAFKEAEHITETFLYGISQT